MPNSFPSASESIDRHPAKGEWSLQPMKQLCTALQIQPEKFASIHVAGTNGKGSVATMVSQILLEAGYRVGTYTSPHLLDARERILINGEKIPLQEFEKLCKKVSQSAGQLPGGATFFEQVTATAFLYFQQQKVDIVVAEVGLGGRLDSTNLLQPQVAVITNISIEHSELLGKTDEEIAFEKAGIIKSNCKVVTGAQTGALEVVRKKCVEQNVQLTEVNEGKIHPISCSSEKTCFQLEDSSYCTTLLGRHQALNAALAVKAVQLIEGKFIVSQEAIEKGLMQVKLRGRLEVANAKPLVVLDGAHNPAAAAALAQAVVDLWPAKKVLLACGVLKDKDAQGIFQAISKMQVSRLFACAPKIERAVPATELAQKAGQFFSKEKIVVQETVEKALEAACKECGEHEMVLVAGSLYTVAEAMKYFETKN